MRVNEAVNRLETAVYENTLAWLRFLGVRVQGDELADILAEIGLEIWLCGTAECMPSYIVLAIMYRPLTKQIYEKR